MRENPKLLMDIYLDLLKNIKVLVRDVLDI